MVWGLHEKEAVWSKGLEGELGASGILELNMD